MAGWVPCVLVLVMLVSESATAQGAGEQPPVRQRPPVVVNPDAEREMRELGLGGVTQPEQRRPTTATRPEIAERETDGGHGDDVDSEARRAKKLIARHAPRTESGRYLMATIIACTAIGMLLLGAIVVVRGRRRHFK